MAEQGFLFAEMQLQNNIIIREDDSEWREPLVEVEL